MIEREQTIDQDRGVIMSGGDIAANDSCCIGVKAR